MSHNDLVPMIGQLLQLPHHPVEASPPSNPDVDVNWQVDGHWYRLRVWPVDGDVIGMSESSEDGSTWLNATCLRIEGRDAVRIMKEISARVG